MEDEVAGAEAASAVPPSPLHFVLVHGYGGGGWCWYKLRCLMENSGYKVSCVDLKSAGIDCSDVDTVLSFDDYNKPIIDFMSALPEDDKVILVGHSAGGLSVTDASYRFGKKVKLAVYITAAMLRFGFASDQDVKDGAPDLSEYGDVYELGFREGTDKPPTSSFVKKEFERKIIYQMSPPEDSTLAAMLMRPGPVRAIMSARFEPGGEEEEVPRVYIKAKQDRVLKPEQQEAMIQKWPPREVYAVDSDHSPFFSAPFMLFGLLLKAVSTITTTL